MATIEITRTYEVDYVLTVEAESEEDAKKRDANGEYDWSMAKSYDGPLLRTMYDKVWDDEEDNDENQNN